MRFFDVSNGDFDTVQVDGSDAIRIPGAGRVFAADYAREGDDLILMSDGHTPLRLVDYFSQDTLPDLTADNGAALRGDLVARLAGPDEALAGRFAQAGSQSPGDPIGQVETIEGTAWAERVDGTRVALELGAKIYANDVIITEDGAKTSVTFVDGTIFTLASASRMVIDSLIFDPDATEGNSGAMSLIEGGFVFIAGEVAKTGGMDVTTPTATMGIRGTTVLVEITSEDGVSTVEVSLNQDPDGGIGSIELFDLSGNVIATITSTDTKWIVSPIEGETREIARTSEDLADDEALLLDASRAYALAFERVDQGGTFVELVSQSGPGANTAGDNDDPNLDGNDSDPDEGDTTNGGQGTQGGGGTGGRTQQGSGERTDGSDDEPDGSDDDTQGDDNTPTPPDGNAPVGQDETISVETDGAFSGQVGATDEDGDALTFTARTPPANGTLTVATDGSYTYTPEAGFAGFDSFDVEVSDGSLTDTVTISAEVTSEDYTSETGQSVSMGINGDPVGDDPAGNLKIDVGASDSAVIKLAFVLDGSGSISGSDWSTIRTAVRDAIEDLQQQFGESETQLEVQVIQYSGTVEIEGTADLSTDISTFLADIGNMVQNGGGTEWSLGLDQAGVFFATEPAAGSNYLYFLTDGIPNSDDPWEASRDALRNAEYALDIEPFGIGSNYDNTQLDDLDEPGGDGSTQVLDADDLLTAFQESPLFNPQLTDFSLTLQVGTDGTPDVIAEKTSPALTSDGIDYDLPLATIEGIGDRLGEENFFFASATFDFDGVGNITFTSVAQLGKQDSAVDTNGSDGPDLLFGSDAGDTISGGNGNDVILGYGGADELIGGDGDDVLIGGAGDDILVDDLGDDTFDGGIGRDMLRVADDAGAGSDLIATLSGSNIEAIDLQNTTDETLDISYEDVVALSNEADTLLAGYHADSATIYGDDGDTVNLTAGDSSGQWEQVGTTTDAGQDIEIYNFVQDGAVLATLGIDDDIAINNTTALGG